MEFGQPEHLVWLWLTPLAIGLVIWAERRRVKRLLRFSDHIHEGIASHNLLAGRVGLRAALIGLATVCFVLAAARPRWGFEWREVRTTGSDIMIAVDVSQSMLAQDVSPNRLERAKREIIDLMRILAGDRIGLIAFAGSAFVQCPLTIDYDAVQMFMDYLDEHLIPIQGTALSSAIDLGTKSLKEASEEYSKGRALILITDGEDHDTQTAAAVERAKENGVKIFVVAVGSEEGAPIPVPGGGFKKDAAGNLVVSRMNPDSLQQIASETGGMFVHSVSGDMDLERIYYDGIQGKIDETDYAEQRRKVWYERFQWFLLAGIFLLVIEIWLPRAKRFPLRQTGIAALIFLSALLFSTGVEEAYAQGVRSAEKAFSKGDYDEARKRFEQLEIIDPGDARHAFNRGVSAYREGQYKEAADAFEKASRAEDKELREQALFNHGNATAMQQQYDQALESYKQALNLNPGNQRTKENMAYVEQARQQQQQQQQGDDQQQNQPGQQDQQQANQSQQGDQSSAGKKNQQHQTSQDSQNQAQSSPDQQAGKPEQPQSQDQQQSEAKQSSENEDQVAGDPNQSAQQSEEQGEEQEQPSQEQAQNEQAEKGMAEHSSELSSEEAERLLNGVQDRGGQVMRNMIRDEMSEQKSPNSGKDW